MFGHRNLDTILKPDSHDIDLKDLEYHLKLKRDTFQIFSSHIAVSIIWKRMTLLKHTTRKRLMHQSWMNTFFTIVQFVNLGMMSQCDLKGFVRTWQLLISTACSISTKQT